VCVVMSLAWTGGARRQPRRPANRRCGSEAMPRDAEINSRQPPTPQGLPAFATTFAQLADRRPGGPGIEAAAEQEIGRLALQGRVRGQRAGAESALDQLACASGPVGFALGLELFECGLDMSRVELMAAQLGFDPKWP